MNQKVQQNKYSVQDFLKLVDVLRSPKGCPWDKLRNHSDIRSNLIEEAYEVIEALDIGDNETLKEELGDLLLQIALHCSIAKGDNAFDFEDVIDCVCKKIIARHPHIFHGTEYVKKSSNQHKRISLNKHVSVGSHCFKEDESKIPNHVKLRVRSQSTPSTAENIGNVSRILPALMRTEKIQEKAAKSGYGLFSVEDALDETFERFNYLENLILEGKIDEYSKEIGNLLFSVTEIARLVNVDAECSLYDSCERFKNEVLYKISRNRRFN